jgi:MFS transporter, DHA1 family, multidrug resistance protein
VLETLIGWRASFVFLIVFGSLALLHAYWRLYETNLNRGSAGSIRQFVHSYLSLFRSRLLCEASSLWLVSQQVFER